MWHGAGGQAPKDRVERPREGGFTLIELLVVIAVLGVLIAAVVLAVTKVVPLSIGAACAANVQNVKTAERAYELFQPSATQLTRSELTDPVTGTLQSWPDGSPNGYSIVLAGDSNALIGTQDSAGKTISMNDVILKVGTEYYDTSKSGAGVCFTL
jgi:prepilin-type N-terminal cleavage/methylation domain-containing protein